MRRSLCAAVLVAVLAGPTAAHGAIVDGDGSTVTFREAAAGERNDVRVWMEPAGTVHVSDDGGTTIQASGACTKTVATVSCPLGPGGIDVETGGEADVVTVSRRSSVAGPIGVAFADGTLDVALGDGADRFLGGGSGETVDGGAGADELLGGGGRDLLEGGTDADRLHGGSNVDALRGGSGDDQLDSSDLDVRSWPTGRSWTSAYAFEIPAGDVLDGGEGRDTLVAYVRMGPNASETGLNGPETTVTLDGIADDGRIGERDNVTDIEVFAMTGGRFVGDDDANEIRLGSYKRPSDVQARGGADRVLGSVFAIRDRIDGGTGDDELRGGFNADLIVGGAGRDTIEGDGIRCNGSPCSEDGDDTIEARDGELDTIRCGGGRDRVDADDIDDVARDCEIVQRTPPLIVLVGRPMLRGAMRHGLRVAVTGYDRRARVRAILGRALAHRHGLVAHRVVARGVGRAGPRRVVVRLRFTRIARDRLEDAERVVLRLVLVETAAQLRIGLSAER